MIPSREHRDHVPVPPDTAPSPLGEGGKPRIKPGSLGCLGERAGCRGRAEPGRSAFGAFSHSSHRSCPMSVGRGSGEQRCRSPSSSASTLASAATTELRARSVRRRACAHRFGQTWCSMATLYYEQRQGRSSRRSRLDLDLLMPARTHGERRPEHLAQLEEVVMRFGKCEWEEAKPDWTAEAVRAGTAQESGYGEQYTQHREERRGVLWTLALLCAVGWSWPQTATWRCCSWSWPWRAGGVAARGGGRSRSGRPECLMRYTKACRYRRLAEVWSLRMAGVRMA